MKLFNFWIERTSSIHGFSLYMTERTGEKNSRSARGKRKKERRGEITGPIVVQEFARQEHYQEKMFRDCALEHDVFRSLVRSPRSPAPEDCPVSSLSTTLSCDHYSASSPSSPFSSCLFSPFGFNRNVMSVVRRARRGKSAYMYTRGRDVSVIGIAFNVTERNIRRCEWQPRGGTKTKKKIFQMLNHSFSLFNLDAFSLLVLHIQDVRRKRYRSWR